MSDPTCTNPKAKSHVLSLSIHNNNNSLFLDRLDAVKYESGKIKITKKKTANKPKFYQKKWYAFISNG